MEHMKRIFISTLGLIPITLMLFAWACTNNHNEEDLYWNDPPTTADTVYQNPVFEPDLADPSVIRAADGWFYAYGTQNHWASGINRITPIVRSRNLVKWEYVADAFTPETKPA